MTYVDTFKTDARFPNAGFWLSDVSKTALNFKKIIRDAERDCLKGPLEKEQLNRNLRRNLSKPGALIALAKNNGTNFASVPIDLGDFPVTQEFRDGDRINNVLAGRISIQKAEFEFTRWLKDPKSFSASVFDYGKSEAIIEKYFGTSIRQLSEAAEKLTAFKNKMKEANLKIESANKLSKDLALDVPKKNPATCTRRQKDC